MMLLRDEGVSLDFLIASMMLLVALTIGVIGWHKLSLLLDIVALMMVATTSLVVIYESSVATKRLWVDALALAHVIGIIMWGTIFWKAVLFHKVLLYLLSTPLFLVGFVRIFQLADTYPSEVGDGQTRT